MALITRAEYMAHSTFRENETKAEHEARCAAVHRSYYAQFISAATINRVVSSIGKARLLASTDAHLNDIKLIDWDNASYCIPVAIKFTDVGDYATLGGTVCVAKEAARQWLESQEVAK